MVEQSPQVLADEEEATTIIFAINLVLNLSLATYNRYGFESRVIGTRTITIRTKKKNGNSGNSGYGNVEILVPPSSGVSSNVLSQSLDSTSSSFPSSFLLGLVPSG